MEHFSSHGHVVYTTAKQVISRRRKNENVSEMSKIKNARAKRAKLLFFNNKYAKLWLSCCCRRRGCVNSLLTIYEAMTATATNTSFENKHLENGDYFAIISSSSHPLLSAADGARCKWTGRSAAWNKYREWRFTVVCSRCRQNHKFGNFKLSFDRLRHRIALESVLHVQHDYSSSFNQSDHCFLASSLPSSLLKRPIGWLLMTAEFQIIIRTKAFKTIKMIFAQHSSNNGKNWQKVTKKSS